MQMSGERASGQRDFVNVWGRARVPEGVWLALHRRVLAAAGLKHAWARDLGENVSQGFPVTAVISRVFTPGQARC